LLAAAVAPVIDPISVITVPAGRTYQLPVTAVWAGSAGSLTYTASTSTGLSASVRPASNTWVDMKVVPSIGTMRFALFDDAVPNTVRRIRGLINSEYYVGLSFHRVISGLLAQGGDPSGSGSGGAQSRFDDEYNPSLQFTGYGQLAMANVPASSDGLPKDQNSSQFFVTQVPQRDLDFNFTLFGQLVRGTNQLKALTALPVVEGTERPQIPPTVSALKVISNTTDAVIQLQANDAVGDRTLTITATAPDGSTHSRTVTVKVVPNVVDSPPILSPVADVRAQEGSRVTIPLSAVDLEGDDFTIAGNVLSGGEGIQQSTVNQDAKTIDIDLKPGFTGAIQLQVGVKQKDSTARGSITLQPGDSPSSLRIYDTQVISVAVGDRPITATPRGAYFNAVLQADDREFTLATFTDEDPEADDGDFSVAIDWGDGTVTANAQVDESNDVFSVVGQHSYKSTTLGAMPVTIYIVSTKGVRSIVNTTVTINAPSSFDNGVLSINGSDADDQVQVYVVGGEVRSLVNGVLGKYDATRVKSLDVRTYDGKDKITIGLGVPVGYFELGDGDDELAASQYDDTVYCGAGNDYVAAGAGNDLLFGEEGKDTLSAGGGKNTLWGGAGDDRLNGSGGRDLIYGGDGQDRLYGNGGDDTLDGQSGVDRIWGGDGNDLLVGGGSIDRLYGEAGDDTLAGGPKTIDYLYGGPGTDTANDNDGKDVALDIEL
jgi:cyclophilin family peptidyl-prolyl cis-trans isomerase